MNYQVLLRLITHLKWSESLQHYTQNNVHKTLGYLPTETNAHTKNYISVHGSFIGNNPNWKEPRCTSTGEGLNTVVHPCHEVLLNYKKE